MDDAPQVAPGNDQPGTRAVARRSGSGRDLDWRDSGRIEGKPATEGTESRAGLGGCGETRPRNRARSNGCHPGFQKCNAPRFPETECSAGFYCIHRRSQELCGVCSKPDFSMCLALSPCESICAKARSRCCLWQTAPLGISSNGCDRWLRLPYRLWRPSVIFEGVLDSLTVLRCRFAPFFFAPISSSSQVGAWSLARGRSRTQRSTPALRSRGASSALSKR